MQLKQGGGLFNIMMEICYMIIIPFRVLKCRIYSKNTLTVFLHQSLKKYSANCCLF